VEVPVLRCVDRRSRRRRRTSDDDQLLVAMVADAVLTDAVATLRRGGLVAFPTETVYGLGADASNPDAVRRLFDVKGRPVDHPVIVHLGDSAALDDWSDTLSPEARKLADAYWPGPLTLVVSRSAHVLDAVTGGHDRVGLRVPDQPIALALLRAFGGGVAAPSANRFGRVSPTSAQDVRDDLGADVDLVLDGGPCRVGVESTIVDCSGSEPALLGLGGVPREEIEALLGASIEVRAGGETPAPGTLPSHYSPAAAIVVVDPSAIAARATSLLAAGKRVALLALAPPDGLPAGLVVLEPPLDVGDYAHVLYARFREADRRGIDVVLTIAPPGAGLGAAVADRLERAAGRAS
jgi:L-threonylcarbamoyladenylate synthase